MDGTDVLKGMRAVLPASRRGRVGGVAGPLPAAFSALSSSAAVYVDYCSPCGYGTGPWDLVTGDGATLSRKGNVGELTQPVAASFLTPAC
jgi:hypothetical protein